MFTVNVKLFTVIFMVTSGNVSDQNTVLHLTFNCVPCCLIYKHNNVTLLKEHQITEG